MYGLFLFWACFLSSRRLYLSWARLPAVTPYTESPSIVTLCYQHKAFPTFHLHTVMKSIRIALSNFDIFCPSFLTSSSLPSTSKAAQLRKHTSRADLPKCAVGRTGFSAFKAMQRPCTGKWCSVTNSFSFHNSRTFTTLLRSCSVHYICRACCRCVSESSFRSGCWRCCVTFWIHSLACAFSPQIF